MYAKVVNWSKFDESVCCLAGLRLPWVMLSRPVNVHRMGAKCQETETKCEFPTKTFHSKTEMTKNRCTKYTGTYQQHASLAGKGVKFSNLLGKLSLRDSQATLNTELYF